MSQARAGADPGRRRLDPAPRSPDLTHQPASSPENHRERVWRWRSEGAGEEMAAAGTTFQAAAGCRRHTPEGSDDGRREDREGEALGAPRWLPPSRPWGALKKLNFRSKR